MGILRKAISGSAAILTGGASLAVVQFRSDTERGTRETKKLRKAIQGNNSATGLEGAAIPSVVITPPTPGAGATDGLSLVSKLEAVDAPNDKSVGWKDDLNSPGLERFWTGSSWTGITRERQV